MSKIKPESCTFKPLFKVIDDPFLYNTVSKFFSPTLADLSFMNTVSLQYKNTAGLHIELTHNLICLQLRMMYELSHCGVVPSSECIQLTMIKKLLA